MLAVAVAYALISVPFGSTVSERLQDVSFDIQIIEGNRSELRKINQDFANAYEQDSAKVKYKEPLLFLIESSMNGQKGTYLINGDTAQWRVPRLGINSKIKIGDSPGKRQSLLDFGVISVSMSEHFLSGVFVKDDSGRAVFDLSYLRSTDSSRHRVWVDLVKKVIMKREWYGQNGLLMATFEYYDHKESNGIWFPSGVRVYNKDQKLAGISKYANVKVNAGISDDVFKL